ncbi:hypothetical protein R8871_05166 [Paraburkholderia graminis C4D1M]|uniref:Uncharacterized protein n=1 Tax=Paraburkholderia graminis (strain ATCC 700544 / DSM 17151 / LMG 18924 / NCIMB 13744 / C4D1M) TaxID=396598 RepID=B1G6F1_PARG4|nr:hypothetical protein BgramDRAFT_4999 [Paraburkholderia graminis C4D1M]CAB3724451.1 hypothetical protein R8871_05166 [Paraburkholderia graminis C4D1M]
MRPRVPISAPIRQRPVRHHSPYSPMSTVLRSKAFDDALCVAIAVIRRDLGDMLAQRLARAASCRRFGSQAASAPEHAKAAPAHRHARRSSCRERYRRLRRRRSWANDGLVLTPNAKHREDDHDRATVDVIDGSGTVLHTYPITLGESNNVDDSEYLAKALESAAHGQLVPDAALGTITARIHTGPAVR